jgi:hypothetical protein
MVGTSATRSPARCQAPTMPRSSATVRTVGNALSCLGAEALMLRCDVDLGREPSKALGARWKRQMKKR